MPLIRVAARFFRAYPLGHLLGVRRPNPSGLPHILSKQPLIWGGYLSLSLIDSFGIYSDLKHVSLGALKVCR